MKDIVKVKKEKTINSKSFRCIKLIFSLLYRIRITLSPFLYPYNNADPHQGAPWPFEAEDQVIKTQHLDWSLATPSSYHKKYETSAL